MRRRTRLKIKAPDVYFAKPVKTSLWVIRGRETMNTTLDFCPRSARKKKKMYQSTDYGHPMKA